MEITKSEASSLCEFIELNIFNNIRDDPDVDNIAWLVNLMNIFQRAADFLDINGGRLITMTDCFGKELSIGDTVISVGSFPYIQFGEVIGFSFDFAQIRYRTMYSTGLDGLVNVDYRKSYQLLKHEDVVHCGECTMYDKGGNGLPPVCTSHKGLASVNENSACGYGERKIEINKLDCTI